MSSSSSVLDSLVSWYQSCCDGDWEHQYGVKIDTLDNPGWTLSADLQGTRRAGVEVAYKLVERTEHDWVAVEVAGDTFRAHGGPGNLAEMLALFAAFVEGRPLLE